MSSSAPALPREDRDKLTEALRLVETTLATPADQTRAIEAWERLMDNLPEFGKMAGELADAVEEHGEHFNLEQATVVADCLKKVAAMMDAATSDKAPNPALVALYYLRQQGDLLSQIEDRLSQIEDRVV